MRAYTTAGLGAVLGFALWMLSPAITGKLEPWDAATRAYVAWLGLTGLWLGWRGGENFWAGPLGLYVGQAFALTGRYMAGAFGQMNYPFPLPLLFLVSYTLPAFLTAAGTGYLRLRWDEAIAAQNAKARKRED